MNSMIEQLWFVEDQFNIYEDVKLKITQHPKSKKENQLKDWADTFGCQIGEFKINTQRKMIEDPMGLKVMPIMPHFIGASEELILQEIYAHLGE